MRLTLVRHGITTWNREGRWQGHTDTPLSPEGEAQARRLAVRLRHAHFDQVWSSDLQRAQQTAQLALPGRTPQLDPRLREVHFGQYDGHTYAENRVHPEFEQWQQDSWTQAPPGGESLRAVGERARAWAEQLTDGQEVVAFTHGGTVRALTSLLLAWPTAAQPGAALPFPLRLLHASITRLVREEGRWALETWNDIGHLERWAGAAD
ncbi:histidine phosphatase family protein [Deinococcus sonorensis]|uniref:Histidine phosphatase family protein n=2 Tax=Deinococcus sonorensis TaxID=309891 RepID=A0AAU7UCP4_9DEIO